MSDIYEGRIAYFANNSAASAADLDFWVAKYREAVADVEPDYGRDHAIAVLTFADGLLATTSRGTLAGMVSVAVERMAAAEDERDALRAELRARDEAVR